MLTQGKIGTAFTEGDAHTIINPSEPDQSHARPEYFDKYYQCSYARARGIHPLQCPNGISIGHPQLTADPYRRPCRVCGSNQFADALRGRWY